MALQRRKPASGGDVEASREFVATAQDEKAVPLLMEFLGRTSWEDGASRLPGSLTVFAEAGRLKACLSDKDAGLVCFVSAEGWTGLLAAAERALGPSGGDWRQARGQSGGRGRK